MALAVRSPLLFALLCVGCLERSLDPPVTLEVPTEGAALAPRLSAGAQGVLLSWIESGEGSHRLRWASVTDRFRDVETLVESDRFFANWADLPGLQPAGADAPGQTMGYWLRRSGDGAYDYDVALLWRDDRATAFREVGLLHDSTIAAEHGFVSTVPRGAGVQAFWLDGRAMPPGGDMQLRTTFVDRAGAGPSLLLDDRVCECCQTGAAMTAEGPLVVYRDRSEDEVRDVSVVRFAEGAWSEPAPVHVDGWRIPGCPVNGPAVAASGRHVLVAWFTAAGDRPRVMAAWSSDAGRGFASPLLVDGDRPLGRVDVALDEARGEGWLSWLGRGDEGAEVRLVRLTEGGLVGEPLRIAQSTPDRAAGFPQLVYDSGRLVLVWVVRGERDGLRAAVLAL